MRDEDKTKRQLLADLEQLRGRVAGLEAADHELRPSTKACSTARSSWTSKPSGWCG